MEKTEDAIERERKAVQAMVGAKGALERVLSHNDRLTSRHKAVIDSLNDIKANIGDLYIRTYRHKPPGSGDGSHFMKLADYINAEIAAIREIL